MRNLGLRLGIGAFPAYNTFVQSERGIETRLVATRRQSGGKSVTVLVAAGLLLHLVVSLPGVKSSLAADAAAPGRAVASEAPRAAQEAMAVLRAGGSAADAAITAALVGGVVNSSSSGIGGGGFVNYWDAATQTATILDFREVAPQAVDTEAFEQRPFSSEQRGRWVGVPGELAGLFELHRRQGRLPWEDVVERAARVAREGFAVGPHMAKVLGFSRDAIAKDPGLKSLWLSGGALPKSGARVYNPRLATTLSRVAKGGPEAFYSGPVAAEIVNTVRAKGGALSLADLAAYRTIERKPLEVEFNGHHVYTMPAPSAGGYMLAHTLGVFAPRELYALGLGTPAYVHALGESFRAALADRMMHFGDPAFEPVDTEALLAPARLQARRAEMGAFVTHRLAAFASNEGGTHHLVSADAAGNVVSITVTVNRGFGAKLLAENSGVLLNDELDDFTKREWVKPFGLKESPNRPRPGARPVSSMTPTLVVKDGHVTLAVGGSGGMTIATNVAQAVVSHLVFGVPAAPLVELPRFGIPLGAETVSIPQSWGAPFVQELERRGEAVALTGASMSGVQAVSWHEGTISAGADPQKHGLALVE